MDRKRKLRIIVIGIVIAVLIFMGISFATRSDEEASSGNMVSTLLSPFQNFFSYIGDSVGDFFGFIGDMKDFQQENVALKEEVNGLSDRLRESESFKAENERLRQLLELKTNQPERQMVACEVMAKDPGNWFRFFTVDKGSSSGIQVNDTVISGAGLVGRVTEVGPNWAQIMSIIDTDSSLGALVSRTQDYAIVDGEMALGDRGQCKLSYMNNNTSLVVGDEIVTSGLGGIYPAGLLIGRVSEVKSDALGYSQYAVIDTAVDFERIKEVMVILQ